MSRLLVQNFGPIVNSEAVYIEPRKITVISGKQGAGKSTIAKLYSEFTWVEKSLVRGDFSIKQLTRKGTFVKSHCSYHNLQNYFTSDTYLCFEGDKYCFTYQNQELSVTEQTADAYLRPQIMYVPAERNFMTAIEHAEKIKNLPQSLQTLQGEYSKALASIRSGETLPIAGYQVSYDHLNKVTWLKNATSQIRMHEAASGFQSLVPLILVARHLEHQMEKNENDKSLSHESAEETRRYEELLNKVVSDNSIDNDTKKLLIKQLSANRTNHRFINIVEEMEQNLFPASQRSVLFDLIRICNAKPGNQLLLTTHSPYVISYLALSVKAKAVFDKSDSKELRSRVSAIVPVESLLGPTDVRFYEVSDEGKINELPTYKGMPDDSNVLNIALGDVGDYYEELVDIEELCNR